MVKIILILLIISSISSAQNKSNNELFSGQQTKQDKNHFLIKDSNIVKRNQDSVKKKYTNNLDNYESRFSAGIGFTYETNRKNDRACFLFSFYSYFNMRFITKYLYLGLGTDIKPARSYEKITTVMINVIPTISINLFKNKISVFAGGGLCLYAFQIIGSILSFRAEYNIYNVAALGFDIKRPNFGDQEFRDSILLLNHIYLAVKL